MSSSIYPPGSEFALCNAQAKLAAAIIAVVNQNLTDCIKGFYKMRKAYITLESIIEAENTFVRQMSKETGAGMNHQKITDSSARSMKRSVESTASSQSHVGASESPEGSLNHDLTDEEISNMSAVEVAEAESDPKSPKDLMSLQHSAESAVFASGVDVYIHSGANFCFGLILLALSMVPSAFKQPLKIIGFKGDKEKGLKMLWQATKFANIQGALAALVLLAYYNASRVVCDILDVQAYPKKRCEELVAQMTTRYPNSRLWMLEQARVAVSNCELEQAIELLSPPTRSPMKQLEALNLLEKSLYAMFLHDYAMCSDGFIASISINKFSKAL